MLRRSLCSSLIAPLVAVALLGGACGDNIVPSPDAGSPPDMGGADNIATPGIGLVVVNSDFTSTSISLLDRSTGQVTNSDCIDSGSQPPGATLALSGDVVLPTQPQPGHPVVAIDRTNSALTWLDGACKPIHQLDVSTGFFSNPHDLIGVSPTKAYVLRYERNAAPTPSPADFDDGDDLLIIDPSVPAITGRVALSPFAVPLAGAAIQARPDHALLVDTRLFVVLNNIDGGFQKLSHGRVVVVDTATDQVTSTIDIPELVDCSGLSYVDSTKTLVVTCTGDFTAADQSLTSGIAYIDVSASPPAEVRHQFAAAFGGRALSAFSGIAHNGALGFAVTPGVFGGEPHDQLWSFDVTSGQATKLADASDSFVFGTLLDDTGHMRVYLTDAAAALPRVQLYSYAGGAPMHQASVTADSRSGLPPREIAWY